jgi:exodeoxyribonuclease VII small subunit
MRTAGQWIGMADSADTATLSFEEALRRLEAIVQQLERGDVPLDQSITLYEEGDKLRAQCQARLAAADARIQQIVSGADGSASNTAPFPVD